MPVAQNRRAEIIARGGCAVRLVSACGCAFLLLCASLLATATQHAPVEPQAPGAHNQYTASAKSPAIVVGFVGGYVQHEDAVHAPVQLAERLRGAYPSGVHVEVFENRRREQAFQEILKLLDADHDGTLSEREKREARIVIYGVSWGGSETLALARELEQENVPVLLSVQVDSIAKMGQNDAIIPANVAEAANFYQAQGWLHGQSEIRATDASRTRILGNFRMDYKLPPPQCGNYPWYDRIFMKQHIAIECDPAVWKQVESLIRSKLPPSGQLLDKS